MMVAVAIATGLTFGAGVPAKAGSEGSVETLRLRIAGTIPARCAIGFSDRRAELALERASGTFDLPFSVDCNDLMTVRVKSRFGAMVHVQKPDIQPSPGFGQEQPYRIALALQGGAVSPTFESRDIRDVPGTFSTESVPGTTTGKLSLSWRRTQPLLGGEYNDILEIRVSGAGETDGRD